MSKTEIDNLVRKLHPLERGVIPHLKKSISFNDLIKKSGMKDVQVMRALQWLENKDVLKIISSEEEFIDLDKNGTLYKKEGMPEKRFLKSIMEKELSLVDIGKKSGLDKNELNISIGQLRRQGAIDVRKDKGLIISITDSGKKLLKEKMNLKNF